MSRVALVHHQAVGPWRTLQASELNVELYVGPIEDAAAEDTIEIMGAIIAYSLSVAPDSSMKKRPR